MSAGGFTVCEHCDVEQPPPRCPWCGKRRSARWTVAGDDARMERRLQRFVVPGSLALAALLLQSDGWRSLCRTFMTMWVHEIGHAVSAWLTGYGAVPGPWRTLMSQDRVVWAPLLVLAVVGALAYRGWQRRALVWYIAAGTLLSIQIAGTLVLSPHRAQALTIFGGDAGMMLIGAALMATFFAAPESHLVKSWLRWGFVVIGATSFVDAFSTWWTARSDASVIPYGELEGVGLSDPTKLVDHFGWSQAELISRHLWVGYVALAALAVGYVLAQRRAP